MKEAGAHEVIVIDGVEILVSHGEDQLIPLNRLFLSAGNVRKRRDPSTMPELAASIRAQGQLQCLS